MCSYGNQSSLLSLPRDECKRILRRLELEAYCSTVSALRAQGDLTNEKKLLLQSLQECLKISTERHGAEVRRAVNDQKLTTVANNLSGPDVSSQWMREGRRLVPLMPRLVPHTVFTATASQSAVRQAEMNKTLVDSSVAASTTNDHSNHQLSCESYGSKLLRNGSRCIATDEIASSYPARSSSCRALAFEVGPLDEGKAVSSGRSFTSSSVGSKFEPVRLSQASRQLQELSVNGAIDSVKTGVNISESSSSINKRKREHCDDPSIRLHDTITTATLEVLKGINAASNVVETSFQPTLAAPANFGSRPPIKLTMAKPVSRLPFPKQGGPAQKVIIVSGTAVSSATTICVPPPANFAQKSVVVSVMKTSTSVPTPTVVTSFTVSPVTQNVGDVMSGTGVSQVVRSAPASFEGARVLSSSQLPNATLRPRLKGLGTRPRTPQMLQAAFLNHGVHPVNNISSNSLQVKPVPLKTTIQIQTDNLKKIVTNPINLPSLATKILPKPVTVVSSVSAVSSGGTSTAEASGIEAAKLSFMTAECRDAAGNATSGPAVQSSLGESGPGPVSQNLLVVQKIASALSRSTAAPYSAFSSSLKQDKSSDLNFDIKSRPTVVINRLHLDENVHRESAVTGHKAPVFLASKETAYAVVPSVGSEIKPVTENSAVILTASNPVKPSGNVVNSVKLNCEVLSPPRFGVEATASSQENDSEDLSAITALLSLKMLPAGVEQFSPSSDDDDEEPAVPTKNDVVEKGTFQNSFISSQCSLILRTVEPVYTNEIESKRPTMDSNCVLTVNQDGNTMNLGGMRSETASDTTVKTSSEERVDLQKGSALHCAVAFLASSPAMSGNHANGSCLNDSDVDNVQSSDPGVCNSVAKDENSFSDSSPDSHNASPDSHNALQLNSHDRVLENHNAPERNKSIEPMSPTLGKRKRRPPRLANEPEPPLPEWCRQALMLLSRVMKYRNPHNEKRKANVASWFNCPVSADEVPDYYDIVRQPMDFSTIKQNLRSGIYDDWSGFHSDMLLVRDNCHLYNAEDTDVRHDCDLVFEFYQQEYRKVVTCWTQQQHEHLSDFPFSSPSRRLKVDHTASSDHAVH